MPKPILVVIVGSTRPGRAGRPIAEWFVERARSHGFFDVVLADLAEIQLPLFDEPHHPRLHRYLHAHTAAWSEQIARADAIVMVTPEYNSGYPAAIKNAIDYLHDEWRDKPVGFVSYGGVSAGTRAVQQLRQVVGALKMVGLTEAVHIPYVNQVLGEDQRVRATELMERAAEEMLRELRRLDGVLRPVRMGTAAN